MELDIDALDQKYGGYVTGPIDITSMPGYVPGLAADEALARQIAAEEANPNPTSIADTMAKYSRPELAAHQSEMVNQGIALQRQMERANRAEHELGRARRSAAVAEVRYRDRDYDLTTSSDDMLRREMRNLREEFERERLQKEIKRSLDNRRMSKVLDVLDDLDLKRKTSIVNWAIGLIPEDIVGIKKRELISNLEKFILDKVRDKLDTIEIERRIRSYFADILYDNSVQKTKPKAKPKPKPKKTKSKKKSVAKRATKKKAKK